MLDFTVGYPAKDGATSQTFCSTGKSRSGQLRPIGQYAKHVWHKESRESSTCRRVWPADVRRKMFTKRADMWELHDFKSGGSGFDLSEFRSLTTCTMNWGCAHTDFSCTTSVLGA